MTIDVQDKLKLFWNVGADSYIRPFALIKSLAAKIPNMGGNGIPPVHKINEIGLMIKKSILEMPKFYSGTLIDEYVVMPDHIHLVIKINGRAISLSKIIQRFKILSTNRYINGVKNNNWPRFNKRLWQRDYYERIIRNEFELERVRKYIRENPIKLNATTVDKNN